MANTDKPRPGEMRDEQTKAAVEQAERAEGKRDRAEGREGEPPEELYTPGPDGTIHLMQEQMIADGMSRDAPEESEPASRVVHVMELQMKGEAVGDYADNLPGIDNTLPDEPLPGKPPEPPLGGSRSGDERQPEPVQYPAGKQRR